MMSTNSISCATIWKPK